MPPQVPGRLSQRFVQGSIVLHTVQCMTLTSNVCRRRGESLVKFYPGQAQATTCTQALSVASQPSCRAKSAIRCYLAVLTALSCDTQHAKGCVQYVTMHCIVHACR